MIDKMIIFFNADIITLYIKELWHISKLVFHLHPGITLGKLNEMIMDSVDLVIVLWDGKSRGTRRILQYVRKQKIPCHLYIFISDYPGDPGAIALRAEFL